MVAVTPPRNAPSEVPSSVAASGVDTSSPSVPPYHQGNLIPQGISPSPEPMYVVPRADMLTHLTGHNLAPSVTPSPDPSWGIFQVQRRLKSLSLLSELN